MSVEYQLDTKPFEQTHTVKAEGAEGDAVGFLVTTHLRERIQAARRGSLIFGYVSTIEEQVLLAALTEFSNAIALRIANRQHLANLPPVTMPTPQMMTTGTAASTVGTAGARKRRRT